MYSKCQNQVDTETEVFIWGVEGFVLGPTVVDVVLISASMAGWLREASSQLFQANVSQTHNAKFDSKRLTFCEEMSIVCRAVGHQVKTKRDLWNGTEPGFRCFMM